jgi:F-type H+-transporting ATPase subunit b
LTVVLIVVVKVVGDSLQRTLDQRRQTILSTLQEADQKARETRRRLEKAQKDLAETRLRAEEIRIQVTQTIERENLAIQAQLEKDLVRFREAGQQAIELERQRTQQSVYKKLTDSAINSAENILLKIFKRQGVAQKELNEIHTRTTFYQLKGLCTIQSKKIKIFYLIFLIISF